MKSIQRLISCNECSRYLEILMKIENDKTEKIQIYFETSYEKYLLQTLLYNSLVRYKINNILKTRFFLWIDQF